MDKTPKEKDEIPNKKDKTQKKKLLMKINLEMVKQLMVKKKRKHKRKNH